jgi:hypothetical protein
MDMFSTLLDELIGASPLVSFGDAVTLFCQGYLLVKFQLRTNTDKSATPGSTLRKIDMIAVRDSAARTIVQRNDWPVSAASE